MRSGLTLLLAVVLLAAVPARADQAIAISGDNGGPVTVVVRDAPLRDVLRMLSRHGRVSILMRDGVDGSITISLFDVPVERAIRSVADAGGYLAERRRDGFVVLAPEEAGKDEASDITQVRTYPVQYSDPTQVAAILGKYVSRYGSVEVLNGRRMLVVQDRPDFVRRIEAVLREVDREPRMILIEAKILEVTLTENENFGIDWSQFLSDGGTGKVGTRGLTTATTGLFFDYVKADNLTIGLDALSDQGRVRTLSTPTLLALEHEEAEVVVGDRLGFKVTTTINQVTTESIEFLESGVILRLKAWVDAAERVMIQVHPEVSTGSLTNGIPNQTTAEVSTTLIARDGEMIFMGGLIKDRLTESHAGAPILRDIPGLGWLFGKREQNTTTTETIVALTAHLMQDPAKALAERARRLPRDQRALDDNARRIDAEVERRGALPWADGMPPAAPPER